MGINRYSYSGNDPINNLDRNGNYYSGQYGVYRTVPYNTTTTNPALRALDNAGRYILNTPTSVLNLLADGIYGAGNLAAPHAGTLENLAMSTPFPGDDAAAAVFRGWTRLSVSAASRVAPKGKAIPIAYQQRTYSETFSPAGAQIFTERAGVSINTIDDLAGAIQKGNISVASVEVNFVVRDGVRVVANTRTAVALQRAGIKRSKWNWVDRTGVGRWEKRVDKALERSKLDEPAEKLDK